MAIAHARLLRDVVLERRDEVELALRTRQRHVEQALLLLDQRRAAAAPTKNSTGGAGGGPSGGAAGRPESAKPVTAGGGAAARTRGRGRGRQTAPTGFFVSPAKPRTANKSFTCAASRNLRPPYF